MVGGIVVEVIIVDPHKVWVNVRERKQECAVYCDPGKETIRVGDQLWWQGDCYWTPRSDPKDERYDIVLKKLSGSGIGRPESQGEKS